MERTSLLVFLIDEILDLDCAEGVKKRKSRNFHRNRQYVLETVETWTDVMFRRQFRVNRELFDSILSSVDAKYPITEISERMAILSSGSCICNRLRLYITLRILAGAQYLDMIWYGVNVDHVSDIFKDMVRKLDGSKVGYFVESAGVQSQ
jgi:hypothetical protein